MRGLGYYLQGMLTADLREVHIPLEAKINASEFEGVPVKVGYYTARYPLISHEGEVRALNHAETYVLEGSRWGFKGDLLVRTGNGLVGIEPEVIRIADTREEEDFIVYRGVRLPKNPETRILTELKVLEMHEFVSGLSGMKTPLERLAEAFGFKGHK